MPDDERSPHCKQCHGTDPDVTIGAATAALVRRLRDAGVDTPDLDARLLLQAATGGDALAAIRDRDHPLEPVAAARLAGMLERRLRHEPVSRIVGEREFFGRPFRVTPATLDPRPETETLIDAALELATEAGWRERPIRILDVGTGTGCILLTLLAELPRATGIGTDISGDALALAAVNAERLGLAGRGQWRQARSLDGIVGPFDLLVSNPPYIASAEIDRLAPEVRLFDPRAALDGGADGLAVFRAIASGLGHVLGRPGICLLEHGFDQSVAVQRLLCELAGTAIIRTWSDLGGHVRCVAARIG